MDVQYGISITNKYDLFFDEDQDPLELISAQKTGAATKEEKAAKKKEKKQLKTTAKEAVPVAPAAPAAPSLVKGTKPIAKADGKPAEHKDTPDEKENKPNANGPRRGGRPPGGEQRGPRPPRQEGDGPKRGGFNAQYQDDVPPRFAGNQDERGGFGDRFGERPAGERGRGRGRGGPRGGFGGRGRGEGRGGGRGGFGGENRGGAEAPEGGGDIFHQAEDNNWHGGEAQNRGGFTGTQANADENRGGFGQSDGGGGRGGFGTFGDEEPERLSGARPPNRGGFGGRGGGRGRGFGGGGPRGDFRGGRGGRGGRQFDRHSGSDTTGVKPTEKREGGGPHNWGTINDALAGETEALNTTVGSDEAPAVENVERMEAREGEGEPQEEAVQEFTLDEWKALQQKEKEEKPQFNIRKPGDGEDPTLWKKLIPLAREKEPKAKKTAEEVESEEDEESHPKKQLLNIEINFIDTPGHGGRGNTRGGPRGFGRGGRGGGEGRGAPSVRRDRGGPGVGRGGGGRGAGGGRRGENFKIDDESFPVLTPTAGGTAA